MTLVKALTIGARLANADPMRPLGVVPGPVESSCSGSSIDSVLGGGRLASTSRLLVLDLPLCPGISLSLSSSGRIPTAFAHEMISSLLRELADEATMTATGDCDSLLLR